MDSNRVYYEILLIDFAVAERTDYVMGKVKRALWLNITVSANEREVRGGVTRRQRMSQDWTGPARRLGLCQIGGDRSRTERGMPVGTGLRKELLTGLLELMGRTAERACFSPRFQAPAWERIPGGYRDSQK